MHRWYCPLRRRLRDVPGGFLHVDGLAGGRGVHIRRWARVLHTYRLERVLDRPRHGIHALGPGRPGLRLAILPRGTVTAGDVALEVTAADLIRIVGAVVKDARQAHLPLLYHLTALPDDRVEVRPSAPRNILQQLLLLTAKFAVGGDGHDRLGVQNRLEDFRVVGVNLLSLPLELVKV